MEGNGGVSTKKNASKPVAATFEADEPSSYLDVLAKALDSGCSACGKALQLSN